MSSIDVASLPYRELQALAKDLNIPANQKKEVLVELIQEDGNNTASRATALTPHAQRQLRQTRSSVKTLTKKSLDFADEQQTIGAENCDPQILSENTSVSSLKPVPQSTRKTRQTLMLMEESQTLNSADSIITTLPYPHSVEKAAPVQNRITRSSKKATKSELKAKDTSDTIVVNIESPVVKVTSSTATYTQSPVLIGKQYSVDGDINNLANDLLAVTFQDCDENEYDEEEEEGNSNDYLPPTRLFSRSSKCAISSSFASPSEHETKPLKNIHMHFASPDLEMGQAVHWSYDDYNGSKSDKCCASSAAADIMNASDVSDDSISSNSMHLKKHGPTKIVVQHKERGCTDSFKGMPIAALPEKETAAGHNNKVMNFWLTKAFSNPIGFFKGN